MAANDDVSKDDLASAETVLPQPRSKPRVKAAATTAAPDPDVAAAEAAPEVQTPETSSEADAVEPVAVEEAPVADLPVISAEVTPEPEAAPVAKAAAKPPKIKVARTPKPKSLSAKSLSAKPLPIKLAAKPLPATKAAAIPAKPVATKSIPAKPLAARPALKPVKVAAKPVPAAAPLAATSSAAKTAPIIDLTFAGLFNPFTLEDNTMNMGTNYAGFQEVITDAQSKAKAAFEKGTSVLGEVSDFTKGNVEAAIESGKILAEGVQGLGTELVAEGRSAFETLTADIKELAAVKSPTDFFKIQGDLMRKSFDSAVAYGSKNSETMLKLFSDAAAPISGRVSLAMEKARSTSL
jgi:hypothetical protein